MTALYHRIFPSLAPFPHKNTPPFPDRNLLGRPIILSNRYYHLLFTIFSQHHFIAILSYILVKLSHDINSKNIFVKKRERVKTVNAGAEYEAAYS